jgi:hypothetical protein
MHPKLHCWSCCNYFFSQFTAAFQEMSKHLMEVPGTMPAPDMCLALHTKPEIVQEIHHFFTYKSIAC